jgi:hypothetical protein
MLPLKTRGDHFRLGSVFIKKSNQTEIIIFLKKKPKPNRNRVKPTGFGSVRFGFLGQKLVQTGLARFFLFWLNFFRFGSVFSVWLGFGPVFPVWLGFFSGFLSVSVRFGSFFWFFVYKTETEPNRPVFSKN